MKDQSQSGATRLDRTRRALAEVTDDAIRRDLERIVAGVEICLERDEPDVAGEAARMVVTAVTVMSASISPERAVAILDGLLADAEASAQALKQGLGFTKHEDAKCDIRPGTPIGSSVCVPQTGSTCYTASSGTGCGGPSGFSFVWEVASDTAVM